MGEALPEISPSNKGVFTFFLVILSIALFGLSGWYWKRIDKSPIAERPHFLVLSSVVTFFLMAMEYAFVNVLPLNDLYCFPIVLILGTSHVSLMASLTARLGLMYWEFRLTQKKVDYARQSRTLPAISEKHQDTLKKELTMLKGQSKWFRFGAILIWMSGVATTFITFLAMNAPFDLRLHNFSDPNPERVELCQKVTRSNLLFWFLPEMIILTISMAWLLLKMRFVEDNFYLKEELWYTWMIMMIPLLYIILQGIPPLPQYLFDGHFDYGSLFFLEIPSLLMMGVSFGFPIWKSYTPEFSKLSGTGVSVETPAVMHHASSLAEIERDFRQVLEDEEGFALFQKFLEQEWSVENILFWKAAVEFRKTFEQQKQEENNMRAKKMFEEFISTDAPLCVNLPFGVRTKVTSNCNEIDISQELFQEAEKEIFNLMLKDSFRRFVFRADSGYTKLKSRLVSIQLTRQANV
jgi:hypothetical protein